MSPEESNQIQKISVYKRETETKFFHVLKEVLQIKMFINLFFQIHTGLVTT